MATFGSKVVAIFYIYLALSIDPINASRVKVVTQLATEKAQQTQEHTELVRELQKALEENHMDHLFDQNSSNSYIGETWASCKQRKDDFERRIKKVSARYAAAKEDGTVTTPEFAYVVLKIRTVASTLSTATKQGCDWVRERHEDPSVDQILQPLSKLQNETKKSMPCHDEVVSFLAGKTDISNRDAAMAINMLFSKDCKPQSGKKALEENMNLDNAMALEEKEEAEVAAAAKKLEAKNEGAEIMSALLERVSEHITSGSQEGIVIVIEGILALIVGTLLTTLTCMLALAIYVFILGIIYCLIKHIIALLLSLLGSHALFETWGSCFDRWIHWFNSYEAMGVKQATAALCLLTTLMGQPVAHFGGSIGMRIDGVFYLR